MREEGQKKTIIFQDTNPNPYFARPRGVQKAIEVINTNLNNQADPTSGEGVVSFLQSVVAWLVEVGGDETRREEARVVLEAGMGVAREVAAEVLERRTKRAVREAFGIALS